MPVFGCVWCSCRSLIGFSVGEASTVTVNETGEYLAGCNGCTQYATGKSKLKLLMLGPASFRKKVVFCLFLLRLQSIGWTPNPGIATAGRSTLRTLVALTSGFECVRRVCRSPTID